MSVGFAFTVKHPVQDAVPPPAGLVTLTLRAPSAAVPDTVTGTVSSVGSTKVTAPRVTRPPEIATVEPATKPDPWMWTVRDTPRASAGGSADVTANEEKVALT